MKAGRTDLPRRHMETNVWIAEIRHPAGNVRERLSRYLGEQLAPFTLALANFRGSLDH